MALLGFGGILELSRGWPEPMALAFEAINLFSSPRSINLNNDDYWTGDRVIIYFPDGSPYGGGNPSGRGVYFGSIYDLSNARLHVTALDDQYYQVDNNVPFYDSGVVEDTATGYIYVDELGRIRLFNSELGAHNAVANDEITLSTVQTGNFVLARYSASSTYVNAVEAAGNSIQSLTLTTDSQELKQVISVPAGITQIAEDPDERDWLFQADIQEWALDIDAANLDMTAIGETFGENTKSLVRGAGTLQFLVDNTTTYQGQDTHDILRLVLLTQRYAKTAAKFYLYKDRDTNSGKIGGKMYYETDVLLTNSRVNIRFDDVITGSADFVATGEIKLRVLA